MRVGEPGGPSTIKGAFDRAFAGASTTPNFKQQGIKEKLSGLYYKAKKISFADVKASFTTRFAKIKEFFTSLPEKMPTIKKFVSDKYTALKGKFTAENLKATKDKVIAGFKDIPKKAAELKNKISNKIFDEAIKNRIKSINWKSVGIKGAIVAGALAVLYAGVKVAKAIFGKNNA